MSSRPEAVPAPSSDSPRAAIVPQRWLDVRSEPPHAAVVLGGELIGYTPLTIMRDTLRPGQRLRLERPGFGVAEAEVPRGAWVRKRGRLEQRVFARLRQITVARDT